MRLEVTMRAMVCAMMGMLVVASLTVSCTLCVSLCVCVQGMFIDGLLSMRELAIICFDCCTKISSNKRRLAEKRRSAAVRSRQTRTTRA